MTILVEVGCAIVAAVISIAVIILTLLGIICFCEHSFYPFYDFIEELKYDRYIRRFIFIMTTILTVCMTIQIRCNKTDDPTTSNKPTVYNECNTPSYLNVDECDDIELIRAYAKKIDREKCIMMNGIKSLREELSKFKVDKP